MTTVDEIMAEQIALQKQLDELKKKLNKEGWERFQRVVPVLFKEHPGLNKLAIRGWTPGFNDGDACTHTTEFYVDNDMWAEYDEDEYWDAAKDCPKEVNSLTDAASEGIEKTLRSFPKILEAQYGSNWELLITKDPDTAELAWNKEYYDCGY